MVEAVPLAPHEPRAQVDFLEDAVGDRAAARASHRREVAVDRVERRQQRRALRRDVEVVQVGFVAVARVHAPDLLVGAVVDHLFALAEPLRRDVALPPGQHRPAAVAAAPAGWPRRCSPAAGRTTRGCRLRRRSSARSARARRRGRRTGPRRRLGRARRHGDHRRLQVRARAEVLHLVGVLARRRRRPRVGQAVGRGDDEVEGESLPARAGLHLPAHGHRLAGRERAWTARSSRRRPGSSRAGARVATGLRRRRRARR